MVPEWYAVMVQGCRIHNLQLALNVGTFRRVAINVSRNDGDSCEGCTPVHEAVIVPDLSDLEGWLVELLASRQRPMSAVHDVASMLAYLAIGSPN